MLIIFSQLPAFTRVFAMHSSRSSPAFELMHSSPPAALQSNGKKSATKRKVLKLMSPILRIEGSGFMTKLKCIELKSTTSMTL